MGREIRRVPANWQHPTHTKFNMRTMTTEEVFHPMFDRPYLKALDEWFHEHQLWQKREHPDQIGGGPADCEFFAQWNGNPPDVEFYRPDWKPEEMTAWQVYETVSEGTPVTPAFETQDELIEYLVENGDYWDQSRRKDGNSFMNCEPWSRQAAERFVKESGWAPSLVATAAGVMSGVDSLAMSET